MATKTTGNPFMFLQPYGLKSDHTLRGREEEKKTLLALLKWKDIIVVIGRSGVGKTSFVNSSLAAISRADWLPVRVTRLLDINKSLHSKLQCALCAPSVHHIHDEVVVKKEAVGVVVAGEDTFEEKMPEKNVLKLISDLNVKWNRPVYLIIDQLEELFLIGKQKEKDEFLDTLRDLMEAYEIQKKVILVIREEHVVYMQEIEQILNGVFQDALRLDLIKFKEGARIYDGLLAAVPDDELAQILKEERIKESLVNFCKVEDNVSFDVQKLQIVLYLLWEHLSEEKNVAESKNIENYIAELVSAVDPLKYYLNGTVNEDLGKNARLSMAPYWNILRNSISDANTKMPVSISEYFEAVMKDLSPSLSEKNSTYSFTVNENNVYEWCKNLADKRLLQEIPVDHVLNSNERYFQLQHDTLVKAIRQLDLNVPLHFPKKKTIDEQERNPYRGLKQYDKYVSGQRRVADLRNIRYEKTTARLYGRDDIIKEYVDFLTAGKGEQCLVIVGDSGTGKSSLVKGGLLPGMMEKGFYTKTLQPGPDLDILTNEIRQFIEKGNAGSNGGSRQNTCLYIDQFEECYTFRRNTDDEKEKFKTFLNFLSHQLQEASGTFKLIVSIRHDYAHEFDRNFSDWMKYKKLLRYPNKNEIFDIIVSPAFERGINFEPRCLPEDIAAEAINTSYFLPLLSFTMRTLYKYDVKDPLKKGMDIKFLLTGETYYKLGGIVKCLQGEFSKVFNDLEPEERDLFPYLMTRMIVIKDTIPKAQPLFISRINYATPGRTDLALGLLKKFDKAGFFRDRDIFTGTDIERSYEPMHDSLLVYCDEIRDIVISVHDSGSQMYLQPRVEAMLKKWKSITNPIEQETFFNQNYKELDPFYDLMEEGGSVNWLFRDEQEMIAKGKKHADALRNAEKNYIAQQLEVLKLKQNEQRLNEEKLKAELALAQSSVQEKQQTRDIENLKVERNIAKTKLQSEQRLKWLIALIALACIITIAIGFLIPAYLNKSWLLKDKDRLLNRVRADEDSLRKSGNLLSIQYALVDSSYRQLMEVDDENKKLILDLRGQEEDRMEKITELNRAYKLLSIAGISKDSIIRKKDSINSVLAETNLKLKEERQKVDSLTNFRLVSLALMNRLSSPAMSYRLLATALKQNPNDQVALRVKADFEERSGYFESIIADNVNSYKVSRDGSRVLIVQTDPAIAGSYRITVFNANGQSVGVPVEIWQKPINVELSFDNELLLVAVENQVRLYAVGKGTPLGNENIANLLYARFAETDKRLFVISNKEIAIYTNALNVTKTIPFESGGIINNGRLEGNYLNVITPKGINHVNVTKPGRPSLKSLPQCFILNNSNYVLAMDKELFGRNRVLKLFDGALRTVWTVPVPYKDFNLITGFVNSSDGRYAIIKFNEREGLVQQLQEQQSQRQSKIKNAFKEYMPGLDMEYIYYLNISNGKLIPVQYGMLNNGSFIFTANNDSIMEINYGAINKMPLLIKDTIRVSVGNDIIGHNASFKQLALAGANKEAVISVDGNNQLKLWRYGIPGELDKKHQLWVLTPGELQRILNQ